MMSSPLFRLIITSFLGSLFYLIIGYLVFDLALGSFTEAHTTQLKGFKKTNDFSFIFLYLSCLAYSLLITFVLHHTTIEKARKIFGFSAIFGLLVACMTDFFWYASSHFYTDFFAVIVDLVAAFITVGCLGVFNFYLLKKLA